MKFKKGDIIKGKKGQHRYTITNEDMTKAEVIEVFPDKARDIKIKIIEHKQGEFGTYDVGSKYFDLVERKNECIVIYRNGNETIALDKSTGKKAVAKCCPEDTFDFNTGARLAFDRLTGLPPFEPKVKEVRRMAKAGEYVKIVNAHCVPKNDDGEPCYKNGDIIRIINTDDVFDRARFKEGHDAKGSDYVLCDFEYVVLEGYEPEKNPLNAKIVFTKGDNTFKTGHIYEIKDGILKDPNDVENLPIAEEYGGAFYSIEDVKDYFTGPEKGTSHIIGWSCETLEFIEVVDD